MKNKINKIIGILVAVTISVMALCMPVAATDDLEFLTPNVYTTVSGGKTLTADVYNTANGGENLSAPVYNTARAFLTEYCYAIDMNYGYDFSQYTSNEKFLNYLHEKTSTQQIRFKGVSSDWQNYKLNIIFREFEFIGDYVFVAICAERKFNYPGFTDDPSATADGHQLIISADGCEVKDFYNPPLSDYDYLVRDEILKITDPNFWDNDAVCAAIAEKQKIQRARLEEFYGTPTPIYPDADSDSENLTSQATDSDSEDLTLSTTDMESDATDIEDTGSSFLTGVGKVFSILTYFARYSPFTLII